MPNYQNGKIYTLRSKNSDQIYIGSTSGTLSHRLATHKNHYTAFLKNKHTYMSSYEIMKFGDCYVELLENYPCDNRKQLTAREGVHVKNNTCCNLNIPGRTQKERYVENPQKYLEGSRISRQKHIVARKRYERKYYLLNRDKSSTYSKKYYKENSDKYKKYCSAYRVRKKAERTPEEEVVFKKTANDYMKNYQSKLVPCSVCGKVVRRGGIYKHKKTAKCRSFGTPPPGESSVEVS